jgi:hypothetical protein
MALDEHEALTVLCGQYDGRPAVQEAGARRSKNSELSCDWKAMTSRELAADQQKGGVIMATGKPRGSGTGRKPASDAGKLLGNPKTPAKVKEVAASDLAQAPRRPKGGKK